MNSHEFGSLEEATNFFEEHKSEYSEQIKKVHSLSDKRYALTEKVRQARLYLPPKILNDIKEYTDIGLFSYQTDGGILVNTYFREFFRNLYEHANQEKRSNLSKRIFKRIRNLAP